MLLETRRAPANDKERLIDSVDRALDSWATYAPYLEFFGRQVRRSRAIPVNDVPDDVITMNSRFAVMDLRTGETISYTLVYPEDEGPERGKLCVLSPMGMALLGARSGDVVHWNGASGPGSAKVLRILYQPEAAGDHHL